MAKQTQKTEPFTSDKLQALEQRLERVQGRLRAIRLSLDEQQAAELFLFNSPSMRLGLQNLERLSQNGSHLVSRYQLYPLLFVEPSDPQRRTQPLIHHW